MIVVMRHGSTRAEIEDVLDKIKDMGFRAHLWRHRR